MSRIYRVGVFEHPGKRGIRLMAYTVWFNSAWEGCCVHEVESKTGMGAKSKAKVEHARKCMRQDKSL